jgi:hypothetical protein
LQQMGATWLRNSVLIPNLYHFWSFHFTPIFTVCHIRQHITIKRLYDILLRKATVRLDL